MTPLREIHLFGRLIVERQSLRAKRVFIDGQLFKGTYEEAIKKTQNRVAAKIQRTTPIGKRGRKWIHEELPSCVIDAIDLKYVSPKAAQELLKDTVANLTRIVGEPAAEAFMYALEDALNEAYNQEGGEDGAHTHKVRQG